MRTIYFSFVLCCIFSCQQKLATHTIQQDNDYISIEADTIEDQPFSFEEAIIIEKSGQDYEVAEVLKILNSLQLLDNKSFMQLQELNMNGELERNFQIIDSIPTAIIFHVDSLKPGFPLFYTSLIEKIALESGISIDSLSVKEINSNTQGLKKAALKVQSGNKTYSKNVIYDYENESIDDSFYSILNDILSSERDAERFYLVKKIMEYRNGDMSYYSTDDKEFGLLKLKREEALALKQYPDVISLSLETHNFPLNQNQITNYVKGLNSAGFFAKNQNIDSLIKNLHTYNIYTLEDIFYFTKELRSCFSPNVSDFNQPYKMIMDSLKVLSNGAFQPKEIIDNSRPNAASKVGFKLKGKEYAAMLENGVDRIEIDGLLATINLALNKEQIDGNFYLLDNKTTDYCYIFMTEEQVDAVNALTPGE